MLSGRYVWTGPVHPEVALIGFHRMKVTQYSQTLIPQLSITYKSYLRDT